MNAFWETVASNAVVATLMAGGALLMGRVCRNAALVHLLWVVVLIKLFTPPIFTTGLPLASRPVPAVILERSVSQPLGRQPARSTPVSPERRVVAEADEVSRVGDLPERTDSEPWSAFAILGMTWFCGSCCVALAYGLGLRRFAAFARDLEPAPASVSSMVADLSSQLGLRRVPDVRMTPRPLPPLVWSLGPSPRVILPSSLFARLSASAQATIIAHELIHIRRGDHLVRLLELAATTVFWWHPVAWLAGRRLRELEEQCCDSRVLELVPDQPRTYAVALVETLEFLSGRPRIAVPLRTAIHSTCSLSRRIQMLSRPRKNRLGTLGVALVAGFVALPLAFGFDPAQKPAVEAQQPGQAAVLRGRVTSKADVPLPGVRVLVAVPAIDMRQIDLSQKPLILEARTDAKGDYRLEIPNLPGPTKVSIDAMMPGFQRLSGTLMAGGDDRVVEVANGKPAEANLKLETSDYFSGIVVNEKGEPIPAVQVGAFMTFMTSRKQRGLGGVEYTATGGDGTFEIFGYPTDFRDFEVEGEKARSIVMFSHPDFVESFVENLQSLEPGQRKSIRVVLQTGHKISGTVLDAAGKPVPKAMVEASLVKGKPSPLNDGTFRKATVTDSNGGFVLNGLMPGESKLSVQALEIKQKISLPMALNADRLGLDVRLQAIKMPAGMKSYDVLGMKLTDVTPELKSAYDLDQHVSGVLILDPGLDFRRLNIGDIAEGNSFWLVGEKRVGNLREFVTQILAETGEGDLESYSVRVVYNFKTTEFTGTNTQHMRITRDDIKQLRALAEKLSNGAK